MFTVWSPVVRGLPTRRRAYGQTTFIYRQFRTSPGVTTGDHSRLQQLVYPNGRIEWYTYGDASDPTNADAAIGRVTSVADGTAAGPTQTLEQYSYQGLGTVLGVARSQANVKEVTKQDQVGRTSLLQWSRGATTTESLAYTYDVDGNVLSRDNGMARLVGHPELGESYTYDGLERQTSFSRGTLTGNVADGKQAGASWQLDSQGNRYGDRYGTAGYGSNNVPAQEGALPAGQATRVPLPDGGSRVLGATYDAWGRLVGTNGTATDASTISLGGPIRQTVFSYDALGRRVTARDYPFAVDPATATPTAVTQSYYDGGNVVEERDGSGVVRDQYVWSAGGPNRLVLRDRDADANAATSDPRIPQVGGAGLDERLYSQTDAFGSVTSITDVAGNVVERYLYDQDGRPTALRADWTTWPDPQPWGVGQPNEVTSHYDWQFLYRGMRWHWVISNDAPNGLHAIPSWGVYEAGGGRAYDPVNGRMLTPETDAAAAGQNAYDPHLEDYTAPAWEATAYRAAFGLGTGDAFYGAVSSPAFMDAADVARPALSATSDGSSSEHGTLTPNALPTARHGGR